MDVTLAQDCLVSQPARGVRTAPNNNSLRQGPLHGIRRLVPTTDTDAAYQDIERYRAFGIKVLCV